MKQETKQRLGLDEVVLWLIAPVQASTNKASNVLKLIKVEANLRVFYNTISRTIAVAKLYHDRILVWNGAKTIPFTFHTDIIGGKIKV